MELIEGITKVTFHLNKTEYEPYTSKVITSVTGIWRGSLTIGSNHYITVEETYGKIYIVREVDVSMITAEKPKEEKVNA